MTTSAKRKVSVTLDADLVAAMKADTSTTLSAEVNSALRAEFTRRRRQQALTDLLDQLADERGGLDTPEDQAEIARRLGREVAIATGTLGGLYRGAGRNQALDALLARESGDGLLLRDTDRTLAWLIGALLSEAGASSALFADAILSPSRSKQAEAWSRPLIPMTSADSQPLTGRSSSSR